MPISRGKQQFQGIFDEVLFKSFTFDPGSLLDAAGETSAAQTVTGVAFGDFVLVAAPYDLQGITVTAYVSAVDTVVVRVQNESGGTLNLADGTWKVVVLKPGTHVF